MTGKKVPGSIPGMTQQPTIRNAARALWAAGFRRRDIARLLDRSENAIYRHLAGVDKEGAADVSGGPRAGASKATA